MKIKTEHIVIGVVALLVLSALANKAGLTGATRPDWCAMLPFGILFPQ